VISKASTNSRAVAGQKRHGEAEIRRPEAGPYKRRTAGFFRGAFRTDSRVIRAVRTPQRQAEAIKAEMELADQAGLPGAS